MNDNSWYSAAIVILHFITIKDRDFVVIKSTKTK